MNSNHDWFDDIRICCSEEHAMEPGLSFYFRSFAAELHDAGTEFERAKGNLEDLGPLNDTLYKLHERMKWVNRKMNARLEVHSSDWAMGRGKYAPDAAAEN